MSTSEQRQALAERADALISEYLGSGTRENLRAMVCAALTSAPEAAAEPVAWICRTKIGLVPMLSFTEPVDGIQFEGYGAFRLNELIDITPLYPPKAEAAQVAVPESWVRVRNALSYLRNKASQSVRGDSYSNEDAAYLAGVEAALHEFDVAVPAPPAPPAPAQSPEPKQCKLTECQGQPRCARCLHWDTLDAQSTTPQAEQAPEGWKLVPIEPTAEMQQAGLEATYSFLLGVPTGMHREAYRAMLAAAPSQPGVKG